MNATIENNMLVLRLPLTERPSKSLKNVVIASTNGNVTPGLIHKGKPVTSGVNAYIKP